MDILQSDHYIEYISTYLSVHDSYVFKNMYYRALMAKYGDTGNYETSKYYYDILQDIAEDYSSYLLFLDENEMDIYNLK